MPKPLTTTELRERLSRRILGPEGQGHRAFLLEEVEIGGRRADAIAVGLWSSRGQLVEGFEIKTSRSDWVRELEDHSKAEPTLAICDRFWLVTNPGVLQPGELPEPWGLLLSNGKGRNLVVEKEAPKLRTRKEFSISREALARLLRRVDQLHQDQRAELFEEARQAAAKSAGFDRDRMESRIENLERMMHENRLGWEAFHRALGLEPWKWEATVEDFAFIGKIANALRESEVGIQQLHNSLRRQEGIAAELTGKINDALQVANDHLFGQGQAI